MKTKINKTNAVRLLDKAKIDYELIPYEVDENDLAAAHVAAQLGENIEQVFKTLVLHGDRGGYFVCVIPGDHELDLKVAAKASGNKKADLIGMKKEFPTFIHESCLKFEYIYISAGVRGLQIRLNPKDLITYTRATLIS